MSTHRSSLVVLVWMRLTTEERTNLHLAAVEGYSLKGRVGSDKFSELGTGRDCILSASTSDMIITLAAKWHIDEGRI